MTALQKIGKVLLTILKYFSLVFFAFVAVLPIVSCVITAFKTETEYAQTNVMEMPASWLNFQNFIDAFLKANMGKAFLNSLIILVSVLTISDRHIACVCAESFSISGQRHYQKPVSVCNAASRCGYADCSVRIDV